MRRGNDVVISVELLEPLELEIAISQKKEAES